MTAWNLDGMFESGTEQKVFSVQEREFPWLTQEEAETRGFRKDCGVADPSRSSGHRVYLCAKGFRKCQILPVWPLVNDNLESLSYPWCSFLQVLGLFWPLHFSHQVIVFWLLQIALYIEGTAYARVSDNRGEQLACQSSWQSFPAMNIGEACEPHLRNRPWGSKAALNATGAGIGWDRCWRGYPVIRIFYSRLERASKKMEFVGKTKTAQQDMKIWS